LQWPRRQRHVSVRFEIFATTFAIDLNLLDLSLRTLGILAALALFLGLAMVGFRSEKKGAALYHQYFDPTPVGGYGIQRALGVESLTTDQSILQQGILYHQQREYDLALVAFRAYLEGQSVTAGPRPYLLAATAAMARGAYEEAAGYLDRMPRDDDAAVAAHGWYSALLDLREEKLSLAASRLKNLLEQKGGKEYPVSQVVTELLADDATPEE